MAKAKVYDIIPPKKKREVLGFKKVIKTEEVTDVSPPRTEEPESKAEIPEVIKGPASFPKRPKRPKRPASPRRKFFYLAPLIIIFALAICWFVSSAKTVKITISPTLEPLTLTTILAFSTSTTEFSLSFSDLSQTIMPAMPIELEKTFTKEFASTEVSLDEKARGTIRVYNKHDRTISLVVNTRFLSSSEPTRQFHSLEKIAIPAGGYVDVEVIASEAGEGHNIDPCVFSVPGLREFSPPQLYYDIFGKSFDKMEGGRQEAVRKVTQEGIDNAKEALTEVARRQIKSVLQEEVGSEFMILPEGINLKFLSAAPVNAQEGQEIKSFVYETKVRAAALKVNTAFLLEFAKEYALSNLPVNKDFVEELLTVGFLFEEGGPIDTGIQANLEIAVRVYSKIDTSSLQEVVKGRTKQEISRYTLEICPEVLNPPRIEFSPFWARRAALEPDNVEIEVSI